MEDVKKTLLFLAPFIGVALGLICIGIGILREESLTVLQKAVNICMECIGIG